MEGLKQALSLLERSFELIEGSHSLRSWGTAKHLAKAMNAGLSETDLIRFAAAAGIEAMAASQDRDQELDLPPLFHLSPPGKLPLYLSAASVKFLTELCEAGQLKGGADEFADAVLISIIDDSRDSCPDLLQGVPEYLSEGWDWAPGKWETANAAMHAVISEWKEGHSS